MFRTTLFAIFAGAGFLSVNGTAHAQYYVPHSSTHIDYVPHSETHFDHVPHGNHYDLVPHTTTHLDAIPHTTSHFDPIPYSSRRVPVGGGYQSYRPVVTSPYVASPYNSYRQSYQHTTTHLDVVPHRGHYHVVPHTTTHRHR